MIWGLGVGYVISGMYFGWNLGLPEGGPYGLVAATLAVTVLYLAFVLGYAELSCALPRAGGAFVYASRAFGPQVGFVGGVAQLVEYVLAPPAIAFAIGSYINQALPGVPILGVAVAAYVVFTAVNIFGVKLSASFELVLTIVAVIELCVFGAVVLPHFSWARFSADPLPHGWGGAFAALPFAIWFYLAIEGIANVAEEAKDPQRDLPRGFLAAMLTLVALTAITLFGAVGADGWQSVVYPDPAHHPGVTSDSPLPLAIGHVVSRDSPFFLVLTGIGLVGLVASFHGILIAASRAILELGRVRYLPASARRDPSEARHAGGRVDREHGRWPRRAGHGQDRRDHPDRGVRRADALHPVVGGGDSPAANRTRPRAAVSHAVVSSHAGRRARAVSRLPRRDGAKSPLPRAALRRDRGRKLGFVRDVGAAGAALVVPIGLGCAPMRILLISLLLVASCEQAKSKLDYLGSASAPHGAMIGSGSNATPAAPAQDIDSKDILAREETGTEVAVKHVLIAWKDLAKVYQGHMDPRASKRTNAEAAALAQDIAAKLRANPDAIDALVKEHSEDPGSQGGEPYTITKDTPFVPEFKKLAMRLKEKEVGVVKTQFGYHVIERVAPPPPDPLESADILARPGGTSKVMVQHVLIGWKDAPASKRSPDPRAAARTKADADKLATEVLAKARAGEDFTKLMKQYSEDPGSKDTGKSYEVTPDSQLVEPFKKLSLRLKEGEAGSCVKSPFGWHIIKRVPPPPPDSLESADILKRDATSPKVKVKHILLGWTDVHADDPRGKKRTRAELETLVKATVAKLQKGDKIEPLMKELSEDPGSAKTGEGYDVTPDAQLVPPFKNLSLRLKLNEVGVVKSDFGIHIIQRVE